jgi:hypothetical protein
MGPVPFCRTGVGHGLDLLILCAQAAGTSLGLLADM